MWIRFSSLTTFLFLVCFYVQFAWVLGVHCAQSQCCSFCRFSRTVCSFVFLASLLFLPIQSHSLQFCVSGILVVIWLARSHHWKLQLGFDFVVVVVVVFVFGGALCILNVVEYSALVAIGCGDMYVLSLPILWFMRGLVYNYHLQ